MADQEYLALYRKYRPVDFDDVRGRDAIVRTLKNQIISGRIGHSYLFCGTRGTGKTTIARIFARAVNCENQRDGNPCGECPACRAISSACGRKEKRPAVRAVSTVKHGRRPGPARSLLYLILPGPTVKKAI